MVPLIVIRKYLIVNGIHRSISAKGSPGLIVPNIITEDPFELLPSEHKVLAMLKDTSEFNTDSVLLALSG